MIIAKVEEKLSLKNVNIFNNTIDPYILRFEKIIENISRFNSISLKLLLFICKII